MCNSLPSFVLVQILFGFVCYSLYSSALAVYLLLGSVFIHSVSIGTTSKKNHTPLHYGRPIRMHCYSGRYSLCDLSF